MKKTISILIISAMLMLLCGCSQNKQVAETDVSVNPTDGTITIFTVYSDKEGNNIQSDSKIKVQIVNSNNETVYEGTIRSSKSEAKTYNGYYYSEVSFPINKIKEGSSKDGILYYWVETSGVKSDTTYQQELDDILPAKAAQLTFVELPIEIESFNEFTGTVTSVFSIDEVSCKEDKEYDWMALTVKGTLLKGRDGQFVIYYCDVYDEEGNLADRVMGIAGPLNVNDSFESEIRLLDLEPGQSYKISFSD